MTIGDRVLVGDGYSWKDEGDNRAVPVYMPVLQENGAHQTAPDGSTLIQQVGGATIGSGGTIHGPPIKVPRSYLAAGSGDVYTAPMGKDFVEVFPIFLDKYQKVGWLPGDNIRIIGGTPTT